MTAVGDAVRAEARIDLRAIRANLRALDIAGVEQMAVVKADAYGHGAVPVARAARESGSSWLGVALPEEALELRDAGDEGPILAWLAVPGQPALGECVRRDIDLGVSARWMLEELADLARDSGRRARVHLKVDTGLGRGGVAREEWPALVRCAVALRADVEVVGVWSHLACADVPSDPANAMQCELFVEACEVAARAGLEPQLRHLASSAAAMALPRTHFDLVRVGIAMYGVPPGPAIDCSGLAPAMTLRSTISTVKPVAAGHGVSYGLTWRAPTATTLALVPLGYADGIPRVAREPEVLVGGVRRPIVGRVAMDQVVVDLGDVAAGPGAEVIVFGDGSQGEPTAHDWAQWCGTIGYEIVTRIGPRVPRGYRDADSPDAGHA